MTTDLREELAALAETQPFSPDPSAWDRGRRAPPQRASAAPPPCSPSSRSSPVWERSPSVPTRWDRPAAASGAASRAGSRTRTGARDRPRDRARLGGLRRRQTGLPVLVDAATGKAYYVELPDFPEQGVIQLTEDFTTGPWLALSPDGRQLAYPTATSVDEPGRPPTFITSWYRVVDLTTGDASWWTCRRARDAAGDVVDRRRRLVVDVYGRPTQRDVEPPVVSWTIDPATGDSGTAALTGVAAPGGGISAIYPLDDEPVTAVPFDTADGTDPERELPADLYPRGASVTPVGWADNSLLVAAVDPPPQLRRGRAPRPPHLAGPPGVGVDLPHPRARRPHLEPQRRRRPGPRPRRHVGRGAHARLRLEPCR